MLGVDIVCGCLYLHLAPHPETPELVRHGDMVRLEHKE